MEGSWSSDKRIQEPDYTIVCIKIAYSDKSATFILMHLQIKACQGGICAGIPNVERKSNQTTGVFELLQAWDDTDGFCNAYGKETCFSYSATGHNFFN